MRAADGIERFLSGFQASLQYVSVVLDGLCL
jgi:hypothetical protein